MKKYTLLCLLCCLFFTTYAAEYLKGKVVSWDKAERDIFYDRTQLGINAFVFQSVYKVFGSNKKLESTVTVTHDRQKEMIFLAIKPEGGSSKGFTVRYDSEVSGIIFSDVSNVDTGYNLSQAYRYVVSFTDANRDFPVLHKMKTDKGDDILLDPISRIRLKIHRDLVKKIAVADIERNTPEPTFKAFYNALQDELSEELFKKRAALYAMNDALTDSVTRFRKALDVQIEVRLKDRKVRQDDRKFFGESRKGEPNGPGLLIDNGNIYQGLFTEGKLTSGLAALKNSVYQYTGQYLNSAINGVGWMSHPDGSYLLGVFSNSKLQAGVSLVKEKDGSIFFGTFKSNQRNGYGELRNTKGDLFFGEFVNGKLVKGYAKEVDQFGYATYSKIENGSKTSADLQMAEDFFGTVTASN